MPPVYKFVELTPVTDETIEECVNDWVQQGWQFDGIRFVVSEHSRRPSMAFVSFTREAQPGDEKAAPRKPPPLRTEDDAPAVITAAHGTDVD